MPALSEDERILLLQIIPRLPAALSLVGSSLIVVAVLKRRGALRKEPYHRMMFCLSLYDVLGGIWMALGSVPVPAEYGIPGSAGNTRICSAQGFFIHFTVGATIAYNTALVMYFLMKVRYNVTDFAIAKWYEPAVHALALFLSLANALSGVALEIFNPIGFGGPSNSPLCYIQAFPPGCDFVPDMECTRGGNASEAMWYTTIVPYLATTAATLVALALVMHTIVVSERRSDKYRFGAASEQRCSGESGGPDPENPSSGDGGRSTNATSVTGSSGGGGHSTNSASGTGDGRHPTSSTSGASMIPVVGKRCLQYGLVFLNTFLWTAISMVVHNKEPPEWDSFWLGCLAFLFMPLQGFFNFLIYVSPRYNRLREENGDKTRLWALHQTISQSH